MALGGIGSFRDDAKGWDVTGDISTPCRVVTVAADFNGLVHAPLVDAQCPSPDPVLGDCFSCGKSRSAC